MTPGRLLTLLALMAAALGTSALLATRLSHTLTPSAGPPASATASSSSSRTPHHHHHARHRATAPTPAAAGPPARRSELGPRLLGLSLPLLIALELAGGALGL